MSVDELPKSFKDSAENYLRVLYDSFTTNLLLEVEKLSTDLLKVWSEKKQVFICGNGGSAANSLHMANDFHYGIGACGQGPKLPGLRVEALPANTGILTCLANDTSYENVYAHQLEVKSNPGDLLIVLSGSGNSPNVINALDAAKRLGLKTYAIVAFNGGRCKEVADHSIHVKINDMQIAEDVQLIVGHLCMQWLNAHKPVQLKGLENA